MAPLALLTFLTSVVVMAIAASLEAKWKSVGFPNNSYRDRERLLLVAGIWGIIVSRKSGLLSAAAVQASALQGQSSKQPDLHASSVYSLVGALVKPGSRAFGILVHLVAFAIAFVSNAPSYRLSRVQHR